MAAALALLFTIAAAAFAIASLVKDFRAAIAARRQLARQIAQFQTMQISWHIRQIGE